MKTEPPPILEDLRASGLPRAFACPGAVRPAAVPISEDSGASALGIAVHEVLRGLAELGEVPWSEIPEVCERHGARADDVRLLCALAVKLWATLRASFADALTEVAFSHDLGDGVTLTGHVDLLAYSGTVARAADWKTGRKDTNYAQQMRGYAALILLDDPELTEATTTVIWIRDGEIENYTMTRAGLQPWLTSLVERVVDWDGVFHPGQHCTYCPRSHECEAANALARRDVAVIYDRAVVARAETELSLMAPDAIVALLEKAEVVKHFAQRVIDAIKAHVDQGGDVVGSDRRLTIETYPKRVIDPLKAWPVLQAAGFGDEDFAACIDMSISKVEKVVATKAGRGKGAAAVRDLGAKLSDAEAITVKASKWLKEKRT